MTLREIKQGEFMKLLVLSLFVASISSATLINTSDASDSFEPAVKALSNSQDRHLISKSSSNQRLLPIIPAKPVVLDGLPTGGENKSR